MSQISVESTTELVPLGTRTGDGVFTAKPFEFYLVTQPLLAGQLSGLSVAPDGMDLPDWIDISRTTTGNVMHVKFTMTDKEDVATYSMMYTFFVSGII